MSDCPPIISALSENVPSFNLGTPSTPTINVNLAPAPNFNISVPSVPNAAVILPQVPELTFYALQSTIINNGGGGTGGIAGVISLNTFTGALNLVGTGGITLTNDGIGVIYISGALGGNTYIVNTGTNYSGELNFATGLSTGSNTYFIPFNPPFTTIPYVQLTQELDYTDNIYPFAIRARSVSGVTLVFGDVISDTGVVFNILAKTATGAYSSTIFVYSTGLPSGVTSLNNLLNDVAIVGTGGTVVTVIGQTIYISGGGGGSSSPTNYSGELNFVTGLQTGSNSYFISFNPPFGSVPYVQLTQELDYTDNIYPFGIRSRTTSGVSIFFGDIITDTGVFFNVLAKTATGSYTTTIYMNGGSGSQNSFNAYQAGNIFNITSGNFRYTWSGIANGTGILPDPTLSSGIEIYLKNKTSLFSVLLSGNVDNMQNAVIPPYGNLVVWSDGQTWNRE